MIYIIRQNEQVKIGYTANIKTRLVDLQIGSPFELSVMLLLKGEFELENELHELFADDRIRGEWYWLSEDIKKYVALMNDQDIRYEYGLLDQDEIDPSIQTKFIRNREALTLQEVGDRLNITRQGVRRIEQSELFETIGLALLKKYGAALGYELQYKFVKTAEE